MKFTIEFEENSQIPFLDILLKRNQHNFSTSIYRKKTFMVFIPNGTHSYPGNTRFNLIRTLPFR